MHAAASDAGLYTCEPVPRCMATNNSPYVFRGDAADDDADADGPRPSEGREVVIVDGRAMSYRWYRR
jgi:hypothetical protein